MIPLGVSPDGFNINRDCGTMRRRRCKAQSSRTRRDLGIALDGDADRLLVADERGRLLDGDQLMALIAPSGSAPAGSKAAA